MKEPLYLRDCYLKSWKTGVKSANRRFIVLDDTGFYPESGGQPWDTGTMKRSSDGRVFNVVFTGRFSGNISHEVDHEGMEAGDIVECEIDWQRRYLFMRYHTASHVLSGIIFKETGAVITGNQIGKDKTRIDFSLDSFDRNLFMGFEGESRKIIQEAHPVKFLFLSREDVMKDPDLVRLAKGMPQGIKEFRIVEIEGFDRQLCGGTHLKNTSEIGNLRIVKMENKGKSNRRVYFSLE